MAPSDLSVLLDMGFEKERAEIAVKKSGGLQGALEWLEANQDKSIDEIKAPAPDAEKDETDPTIEPEALKPGEVANSLMCNDCGRRFRSTAQAEFHASKTEHQNFSESTEEIAPLTEEEKKAKLEELREKMAEKRARQAQQDKEENKKNEVCFGWFQPSVRKVLTLPIHQAIRRKATKEVQDIKEDLQKKEQIKEAAAKRKEKQEELAAKERIRAQIKATQEERRLKAAREKAAREGQALPQEPAVQRQPASSGSTKPASAYSESRLRLQLPSGTVQKSFPADTTLFEVAAALEQESGSPVESFTQNFPRKTFNQGVDFGLTLKEAGLVPSAVLIVR
ncbi:hypothetical protein FGG08_001900 [Glutinoglossum americanum]|uniref:UBX domain-containing protein n=1 Tax=Glutinoglossum americanum TaxID=1670608 RepID=A0A9P8L600_9PEZI|nr:hypothetical protein FGG08_001900 [Glutinoglossum americanum]